MKFKILFPNSHSIIAMVHLKALPNTPAYANDNQKIIEQALAEARLYQAAGVDGIMIENMHDTPYLNGEVGHEVSSLMSIIAYQMRQEISLPLGIQVLAGANKAALAIAKAANLDFVRVEGFVFGHVADEGWMNASAGELLRYRKQINADDILVLTDIKKKHSAHATTADVSIVETAKAAAFFRSDGVIITGSSTGQTASVDELSRVKEAIEIPAIIGSGVRVDNFLEYKASDALIVGSFFKKEGFWGNDIDPERLNQLMDKVRKERAKNPFG